MSPPFSFPKSLQISWVTAVFLLLTQVAQAASPSLDGIQPRGGQIGTDVVIQFQGSRLADIEEILFYQPGIQLKRFVSCEPEKVVAEIHITDTCIMGEHPMRLRGRSGITELRTFWVGPFPNIDEGKDKHDFATAQSVALGTTVNGVILNEEVDYYAVDLKTGDLLSVEVEAMRLGAEFFDPRLAIFDANATEVAACDDTPLLVQDSYLTYPVPTDGRYVIEMRDSQYGGSERAQYRLHVGDFPRPAVAWPPGGSPGENVEYTMIGDVGGDFVMNATLPSEGGDETFAIFPEDGGKVAPSPVYVRVNSLPVYNEGAPNHSRAEAIAINAENGIFALHGVIEAGKDDWYQFQGTKDQELRLRVYARSLRSPLDPVLEVYDSEGKSIANDDDSAGIDPQVVLKIPNDGPYWIRLKDHLGSGGPDYTYRLESQAVQPELTLSLPVSDPRRSQERQVIPVPVGNRYATVITATRQRLSDELEFSIPDLPEGVELHADQMPKNVNQFPLVFEAAADSPIGGRLLTLEGRGVESNVVGYFNQITNLVLGDPNNTVYYDHTSDRLPLAVVEKVPFHVELVPPELAVVKNGTLELKVRVERESEFDKAIDVRLLWFPPGLSGPSSITIPEGESEGSYVINANDKAEVRAWRTAALGEAASDNGTLAASSALTEIRVEAPYVEMKLEMAAIVQGESGELICKVTPLRPFEGRAKMVVKGLPTKVSSEALEFSADSKELILPIKTDAKSPVGKHKQLFCEVLIPSGDGWIPHTTAQGGVLRIDAPQKNAAKQPVAKPKTGGKRLTRLEELRLNAEERRLSIKEEVKP